MPPRFTLTTLALLLLLSNALLAQSSRDRTLSLQIALEREGFSPGLLDARAGRKTAIALTEFQRSRNLAATGQFDSPTLHALAPANPTISHTIRSSDLLEVTGPNPKGWIAKSRTRKLGYESNLEALSERFHCSPSLLQELNPSIHFTRLKAGDPIIAPNIPAPKIPRAHHLDINLAEKIIHVKDPSDKTIALFHCSIAKHESKRPAGQARITAVAFDPTYKFDPKMWPEVKGVNQKLLIPPGPNNPVGKCWISLSLPGYGIHGNPNPELIGKTGSHGCFRLTNWDAQRLGRMIQSGTPVRFYH